MYMPKHSDQRLWPKVLWGDLVDFRDEAPNMIAIIIITISSRLCVLCMDNA